MLGKMHVVLIEIGGEKGQKSQKYKVLCVD